MPKKLPPLSIALATLLDFCKRNWFLFPLIAGFLGLYAALPNRVQATEKKVAQIETQTVQIGKYIEAMEKERELKKMAPPGFIWSETEEKYLPDPEYVPPAKKAHR